jgi:hypothetical protein
VVLQWEFCLISLDYILVLIADFMMVNSFDRLTQSGINLIAKKCNMFEHFLEHIISGEDVGLDQEHCMMWVNAVTLL